MSSWELGVGRECNGAFDGYVILDAPNFNRYLRMAFTLLRDYTGAAPRWWNRTSEEGNWLKSLYRQVEAISTAMNKKQPLQVITPVSSKRKDVHRLIFSKKFSLQIFKGSGICNFLADWTQENWSFLCLVTAERKNRWLQQNLRGYWHTNRVRIFYLPMIHNFIPLRDWTSF